MAAKSKGVEPRVTKYPATDGPLPASQGGRRARGGPLALSLRLGKLTKPHITTVRRGRPGGRQT